MYKRLFFIMLTTCMLSACAKPVPVDLIVYNANIYTLDEENPKAEAFAVKDGKFVAVGNTDDILARYSAPDCLDMQQRAVYPGFNDAHCHFFDVGCLTQTVNLRGTTSIDQIVERLQAYRQKHPKAAFIVGDCWDQNLWKDTRLPDNRALNKAFPDIPVYLHRKDYHAIWMNNTAIRLSGLKPGDPRIAPGEALMKRGAFSGIFLEKTRDYLTGLIPEYPDEAKNDIILSAQQEYFSKGVTSLSDAGVSYDMIARYDSLQKAGSLKIRINAMLMPTEENFAHFTESVIGDRLRVSSIKLFIDGALGSRGAWMFEPYSDDPDNTGIRVLSDEDFKRYCRQAARLGWQVATHAIGDAGVSKVIDIYSAFLEEGNDLRWRIEHAQTVREEDFARFSQYNIIPSVQPTHWTSDMLWAVERLGPERIKGAYAHKRLYDQTGFAVFGTDAPVEETDALHTFYSAVTARDREGRTIDDGSMRTFSREQALKGLCTGPAYADFEEHKKGSIKTGKFADFVVLNRDIMTIEPEQIPDTKVVGTFVDGQNVYIDL